MTTAVENFSSKALTGMALMGSVFQSPQQWPFVLSGEHDEKLQCAIYKVQCMQEGKDTGDVTVDDIASELILYKIESLKHDIRSAMQTIIDMADKEEQQEREQALSYLRAKWNTDLHSPSEHGTVAEICEKYGLSKKKVRQMKRDGTLDKFIAQHV